MSALPPAWFVEIIEATFAALRDYFVAMQRQADEEGCGPAIAAIRFAGLPLAPPSASPDG